MNNMQILKNYKYLKTMDIMMYMYINLWCHLVHTDVKIML